jgi:tetratricopeptide (TPR) repeat protein
MTLSRKLLCCSSLLLIAFSAAFADQGHHASAQQVVGKVSFPVSCAPAVQERFNRAVAILHSFWYDEAGQAFSEIAAADPTCAMAHWGIAMSLYQQLWEPPLAPGGLERGWAEIQKAQSLGAKTERERGFIEALAVFYKDADHVQHRTRALAYRDAMEKVHQANPEDREAALFHALSLIATAQPSDKSYAQQRKAGAIIEPIYAEQPNHPGAAHYLIHAYDNPVLAPRALAAARSYAKIAPSMPHALHMPSHIFVRLGYWQEVIDSNVAAKAASRAEANGPHKKSALGEQFHAMDYLMYGYLQSGRYRKAKAVLDERNGLISSVDQAKMEYAASAIPARYAVEQHRWAEAAELSPGTDYRPAYQALTYFARAIGAARSGKVERAREDVAKLQQLYEAQAAKDVYWADQIKIQHLEASAWVAHAAWDDAEAVRLARSAADLEDATEKRPVTPGPIVPARENLGDLLAETGNYSAALAEYKKGLEDSPNRFNGLYGAARAAEQLGEKQKAKFYYAKLVEICGPARQMSPELQRANAYLKLAVVEPAK